MKLDYKSLTSIILSWTLTCFLFIAPLAAWDEPLDDEDYSHTPDTTYLHDEAYWPTKLQDPFTDQLMK